MQQNSSLWSCLGQYSWCLWDSSSSIETAFTSKLWQIHNAQRLTAQFGPATACLLLPIMDITTKLTWHNFLSDEHTILAAMAQEICDMPAWKQTLEKYYYRYASQYFKVLYQISLSSQTFWHAHWKVQIKRQSIHFYYSITILSWISMVRQWEALLSLAPAEQAIFKERKQASQARYRAAQCEYLANKECHQHRCKKRSISVWLIGLFFSIHLSVRFPRRCWHEWLLNNSSITLQGSKGGSCLFLNEKG